MAQAVERLKAKKALELTAVDPVDWIESRFYIPELRAPMKMAPYQKRALREALKIENGQFKYSTIIWGEIKKSAKCLHPDTWLYRDNGHRVKAKDVKPGDVIQSWAEKRVLAQVSKVEPQIPSLAIKLRTVRGREITVSAEHPFLVYGDKRPPATMKQALLKPKYKWIEARHLQCGDRLCLGMDWAREEFYPIPDAELYLLGAYLGDGGAGKITTAGPEVIGAFRERFQIGESSVQVKDGRVNKSITYKLLDASDWMRQWGFLNGGSQKSSNYGNAYTKKVPEYIFHSGRSGILSFLAGYLDTDGFVSGLQRKQPQIAWASVNKAVLTDCQTLLQSVGFNASLIARKSKYKGLPYTYYQLSVYGKEQVIRLAKVLPLKVGHKKQKLDQWAAQCSSGWVNDLYGYDRIESIEFIPEVETIAIEVDSTHTHITNGFITHNTSISAGIVDWFSSNHPYSSCKFVANSLDQASSRAAKMLSTNFQIHPRPGVEVIPSRNQIKYPNQSEVKSIPINPSAEAGGNDSIVAFDELWGAHETAKEILWTEMTLSPTRYGKSFRLVTTYAGYLGESNLLWTLYNQGVDEYAQFPGQGKRFDWCDEFDPPLECYYNEAARLFCLWNTVPRLPWQTPEYYCLPLPKQKNELMVLTELGWKSAQNISEYDFLATRNQSGYIEYQNPISIFRSKYSGKLIRLKQEKGSMTVTPNHRVLAAYVSHTRKHKEVVQKPFEYEYKTAAEARDVALGWIPCHGDWNHEPLREYQVEGQVYNGDDWVQLVGWYLAEGHVDSRKWGDKKYSGNVRIAQDPKKNKTKYEEIVQLCTKMGLNFKRTSKGVDIYDSRLARYFIQFGKSQEKYIPRYILNECSVGQIRLFLGSFLKEDGTMDGSISWLAYTNSDRMALDLMEAGFKCGYKPRHLGEWRTNLFSKPIHHISLTESHLSWSGKKNWSEFDAPLNTEVWCPTLPNGNFYVKQGDTCFWTGNSQEASILVPSEFNRVHRNQWSASIEAFVPIEWWDACKVDQLPPLDAATDFVIVGVDAAVSQDCFGIVAVSRHGDKIAVRYVGEWKPPRGGKIEFVNLSDPDDPKYPEGICRWLYRNYNILEFAYDQTHLSEMANRMQRGGFGLWRVFSQGTDRLVSDKVLYDMIARKAIMHDGDPRLQAHIQNANVELKGDRSMRLVKRAPSLHIDLAVSLSMAVRRAMHYRIG